LTGTLAAQGVNPLSALTTPRAVSDLTTRRVTDLEVSGPAQSKAGVTRKTTELRTAPSPTTSLNVLTRIRPSATFAGTTTLSCLGVSRVSVWAAVAVYGANRTSPPTEAVVAVPEFLRRFVPTIITSSPGHPPHGQKNVMVGEQPPGFAFVKSDGLLAVALALVTWIVPLASPATVAQISFPETILNADTGVPPISTLVTIGSLKFVPLISTTHPDGPLVGENDEMVGGDAIAGVPRPSASKAAATQIPATRRPPCRSFDLTAWVSLSAWTPCLLCFRTPRGDSLRAGEGTELHC
jgi:hypothetical protein